MSPNPATLVLLALLTVGACQAATLQIYAAEQAGGLSSWDAGPYLRPTCTLCRDNLTSAFTVVCTPRRPAPSLTATLFLDGRVARVEAHAPYTLRGDTHASGAVAWRPPSRRVVVRCVLSNGEAVQSVVTFACAAADDGARHRAAMPAPVPRKTNRVCVHKAATEYDSMSGAWVRRAGEMIYRPGHKSRNTDRPGRATLTYSFTAPATSRFALTLVMRTSGGVDHNDVWIMFQPGGFILTRGSSTSYADGFTKAYHNRNGVSNMVFSVDFRPHSFATRAVLRKGTPYSVNIGGRSTKTAVIGIILFPCAGRQCDSTSAYWRSMLKTCE